MSGVKWVQRRARMAGQPVKQVVVAACIALLTACATKEQTGTLIGAVVGGIVGQKIGGDRGKVVGALIGAALGNRVGAHLDEEDQKRLASIEREALETGQGGSFVSNKSKAKVTVHAATSTFDRRQDFALSSALTPQPLVAIDPTELRAHVDTPVYSDTDAAAAPRFVIQQGVAYRVAANVQNKEWVVVGDSNVGIGYVQRRYLDPSIARALGGSKQSTKAVAAQSSKSDAAVAESPSKTRSKPEATAKRNTQRPAAKRDPQPTPSSTAIARAPAQASAQEPAPTPTTAAPRVDKAQYEREMSVLTAAYRPRSSGDSAAGTGGATQQPAASSQAASVQVVQASTECKVVTRKLEGGSLDAPLTESIRYCKEPPKGWQTQTA